MHFVFPFPLLLLFNCRENMLWLACFCQIKYILLVPTYHLRVLSCLLFSYLQKSLLYSAQVISLCMYSQTPDHAVHLCSPWPCISEHHHLLRSQTAASLAPGPALTPLACLGLFSSDSSSPKATLLSPRAEKAIKEERKSKKSQYIYLEEFIW